MRSSVLFVALGSTNAAMAAMFGNASTNAAPTNKIPALPDPVSFKTPDAVGEYVLYGCVSSNSGFSSFSSVAESKDMSLNLCAASCSTEYFGVHDTNCFCGDEVNDMEQIEMSSCSLPCPGNDVEACGGKAKSKRDRLAVGTFMTMYQRMKGPVVLTKIQTVVHTITSCAPAVTQCPVGQKSTEVKIVTTKITASPEWHDKKIVCYGDQCANEKPCTNCPQYRVLCQDSGCWTEITKPGEDAHKLVKCDGKDCHYPTCQGDQCNTKIICYAGRCTTEKCVGDECKKNLVCRAGVCKYEKCSGDDCHQKKVCNDGEKCKVIAPCSGGDQCPKPAPPVIECPRCTPTGNKPIAPSTTSNMCPGGVCPSQPPVMVGAATKQSAFGLLGAIVGIVLL